MILCYSAVKWQPGTMVVRNIVQEGEVELSFLSNRMALPEDPRRRTPIGPPAFWHNLISLTMVFVPTG